VLVERDDPTLAGRRLGGVDRTPRLAHRPALDGLRGAAVLSVLLYHTGVLRGGWIGVDTFFVLSGYLITSLLLAEHDRTGGIALKAFWGRRARRLLPALFLLLAGVGLFAALVATAEARGVIRQDVWGALTYSSNWLDIVRGSGYWQTFTQPSPLAHVWSLAIEEQFYLVWPLVAWWALRRGGARRLVTVAAAGGVLLAVWAIGLAWSGASVDRVYLGTDTRAPALLLGATLGALRVGAARPEHRRAARAAGLLGMALLVWAAFTLDGRDPEIYRGALLGVSLAGGLAVLGASQEDGGWFGRVVGWRPLCVLGILSYGIYLAHWPILLAVQRWYHLGSWATTAVVVPLTIGVAAASYAVVEHPIRLRRGLAWSRPALLPIVAAGCAVAAVAGTIGARPGLRTVDERTLLAALPAVEPSTAPGSSAAAVTGPAVTLSPSVVDPLPSTTVATTAVGPGVTPATVPATVPATALAAAISASPPAAPLVAPMARPAGRTPRVLAVGDSVAYSLSSALATMGQRSAIDVAVRAAPGCTPDDQRTAYRIGPATKREPSVCLTMVQRWPADVERFQPDLVLLLYGGFTNGWLVDGQPLDACDPAYAARYGALLDHAIDTLSAGGARVVVALPAYNRVFGPVQAADATTDCLTATYTDAVARHADRAALLRLDLFACPTADTCDSTQVDGARLRFDGLHYRGAAARLASQWILDQMVQPAA
jgi:peptidoglycan/LPS O-acetylase OafA/YrhL